MYLFSCDSPLTFLDLLMLNLFSPSISHDTILFWLKKPGGGKKMHSVFDALLPWPLCISSPNLTKWLWISDRPNSSWRRSSKGKATSSTYNTQNRVSKFPCDNVFTLCPVSLPVSCNKCERYCNVIMFKPALVHYFSSVSAKAITMKRNRTGGIQSPCLTPTVWLIVSLFFPILRTIFKSWYILAMEERSFGGGTIFLQNLKHQSVINGIKRLDEVHKRDVSG